MAALQHLSLSQHSLLLLLLPASCSSCQRPQKKVAFSAESPCCTLMRITRQTTTKQLARQLQQKVHKQLDTQLSCLPPLLTHSLSLSLTVASVASLCLARAVCCLPNEVGIMFCVSAVNMKSIDARQVQKVATRRPPATAPPLPAMPR